MLEALAAQHEVISIEQIDYEGEYAQNAVRYIFFRRPSAGVWFPFRLHRLIRDLEPDLVLIQGLHFPVQVVQLRLALGSGTKLLLQHSRRTAIPGFGQMGPAARGSLRRRISVRLQANGRRLDQTRQPGFDKKIHQVMEVSSVFYPVDRRFRAPKKPARQVNRYSYGSAG